MQDFVHQPYSGGLLSPWAPLCWKKDPTSWVPYFLKLPVFLGPTARVSWRESQQLPCRKPSKRCSDLACFWGFEVFNIGALITTYTTLGVPYYNHSTNLSQNPIGFKTDPQTDLKRIFRKCSISRVSRQQIFTMLGLSVLGLRGGSRQEAALHSLTLLDGS